MDEMKKRLIDLLFDYYEHAPDVDVDIIIKKFMEIIAERNTEIINIIDEMMAESLKKYPLGEYGQGYYSGLAKLKTKLENVHL